MKQRVNEDSRKLEVLGAYNVCLGKPQTILQTSSEERTGRPQMVRPWGKKCQISCALLTGFHVSLAEFEPALVPIFLFLLVYCGLLF